MNDSLWTPTRDSAAARAFMATLRLHSVSWEWAEQAEQARWWVLDARAIADLPALLECYGRMPVKPRVAFLAAQLSALPCPAWTFFKPPVQSGLIFNWIRPHIASAAVPPDAAPDHAHPPWRHGLMRLRRWPNVSRYGNALELTVACSRLLTAPASYEQVLQWNVPAPLLDQLLADTHRQGLLLLEQGTAPAPVSLDAPDAPAVQASGERSRWDLIKRLLGKFART